MSSKKEGISSLNLNKKNICSICKINNGEIVCQDCYPTNIFCEKCSESIHELPSKENHNRRYLINDNENSGEMPTKRFNNNNSNLETTFSQTYRTFKYEPLSYCSSRECIYNNNLNSNLNQTTRSNKSLNSLSNLTNKGICLTYYNYNKDINNDDYNNIFDIKKENNIVNKTETNERGKSHVVNNYIEQIRKMYEIEHDNIRLQQCQLQKKLSKTKEANERQINFLNSTINEMKSKNENDIKNLIEENEFELKGILDKKEKEINTLSNRNFELEMANNDLIEKINGISDTILQDNTANKDKISYYQSEIDKLSKNNNDLKNYYEQKLDFLTRIFSEEKNRLMAAYESHIDEMNLGYFKTKKEYMNKAQSKDNKLRTVIDNYSLDANKLNKEIKYLNDEIVRLKNEEEELIKKNEEMKRDNDILNENYQNAKKDLKFQIKQKEIVEKQFDTTQKEFYKLKAENEKLNRLTYGNFKRSKSKGF